VEKVFQNGIICPVVEKVFQNGIICPVVEKVFQNGIIWQTLLVLGFTKGRQAVLRQPNGLAWTEYKGMNYNHKRDAYWFSPPMRRDYDAPDRTAGTSCMKKSSKRRDKSMACSHLPMKIRKNERIVANQYPLEWLRSLARLPYLYV